MVCASRLRILSCLVRAFSLSLSAFEDRRVSSRRWRAIIHHVLILSCVLMVPRFLVLSSRPSTLGCLWQPPFKSNPNCDRDRNCNAPTRRSSPPPPAPIGLSAQPHFENLLCQHRNLHYLLLGPHVSSDSSCTDSCCIFSRISPVGNAIEVVRNTKCRCCAKTSSSTIVRCTRHIWPA